jgi:oligopeptide transport system substrate-binding protein
VRSILRPVLVVLLATAILTGCGSKHGAAETPKQGGVLREGLVQLGSTDPAKAQTVSERQMADQLYDGLTSWDPNTLTATPSLAANWEASSDQKHWTFHLRPDARAANGDTVTATDVKRSLEHIARKSSGSVSTDLLSDVDGFNDFTTNDKVDSLLGVVVVDPQTVRIDLTAPFVDLPMLLGNPTFGIVHYGAGSTTYTTGPFMVSSRPDNTHVVLTKAPGSTAHLDTIDVTYYPDVNTSYGAFQKNQVDWTPVSPDQAANAGKTYGTQLFRTSLRTLYLSFNLGNTNVGNMQFRQAIVQAIDRTAVVNDLGASAKVLDSIPTDDLRGPRVVGCGAPCAYNVNNAKTLLAQAFPNGGIPALTITAPQGDPLTDTAAQRIVSDLAAVGITATVNRLAPDKFDAFTVDPTREIFQTSWSAAYPSSGAFLQPLFQGGLSSNVTAMNDAKTNADIATAESTADPTLRNTDFATVETDVINQMPVIPLAAFPADSVEHTRVRGVNPLPTGNFDAAIAWVTSPKPSS